MRNPDQKFIDSIDLSDSATQDWVLRQDKQTRLEGLCVEYIFERMFLKPHFPDDAISTDWWFIAKDSSFLPIKLLQTLQLSSVDVKIIDNFKHRGITPGLVYYHAAKCRFLVASSSLVKGTTIDIENFRTIKKFHNQPPKKKIDSQRQSHALQFLEQRNLLQAAAVQRFVANWILPNRMIWDFDWFLLYHDAVLGFEIKQKYPSKEGIYGLNVGLKRLFDWLERFGIKIYHLVLTKPIWEEDFHALELLENKGFWEYTSWLITRPTEMNTSRGKIKIAPKKTSIHSSGHLKYHSYPIEAFSVLGSFIEGAKAFPDFLKGKSFPKAHLSQLVRLTNKEIDAIRSGAMS